MAQAQPSHRPRRRRKRKGSRLPQIIFVLVVIGLIVAWVMVRRHRAAQSQMESVRTAQVQRSTIVQTISATGTISAETGADVKIGSQISGVIQNLYADIGTKVKAGQVIAVIAAPDIEANLRSAEHNLAQAEANYQQQLAGQPMEHIQLTSALAQASESVHGSQSQLQQSQASVTSAQSRLKSAQSAKSSAQASLNSSEASLRSAKAALQLQSTQTSTGVQQAQAALSTAKANLKQVEAGAALQVADSQAALKQAEANASLAQINLKRQKDLLAKGFAAQSDVDSAQNQADVTAQQVDSAKASLDLTKQKVAADVPTARDQVAQAQAALDAAQAGSYQNTVREEAVKTAEANVASSQAALAQAAEAVNGAEADLKGAQAAAQSSAASLASSEAAHRTAVANMAQDTIKQQQVAAAADAVGQAKAQVAYQQVQYNRSKIRSPISGTVVTLTEQQGETVAAQFQAPTLIEVVDLDRLQVDAYVDETDIGQVKIGQEANVTVDAYPDDVFKGTVTKIASAATLQQNVVTYLVTVKLAPHVKRLLKPQMTANVDIIIKKAENVLTVPVEAVKQGVSGSEVVVLKNGQGEIRQVKTGLSDDTSMEITSGLKDGDTVVLAGFDQLGIQGFGGAARIPRFFQRTPFGTTSQQRGKGGRQGQQGQQGKQQGKQGQQQQGQQQGGAKGAPSSGAAGQQGQGAAGHQGAAGQAGARQGGAAQRGGSERGGAQGGGQAGGQGGARGAGGQSGGGSRGGGGAR